MHVLRDVEVYLPAASEAHRGEAEGGRRQVGASFDTLRGPTFMLRGAQPGREWIVRRT